MRGHGGYERFPDGFFDRIDDDPDERFYTPVRMVTHIDDQAIGAVGELYDALDISGRVLDLMSSWISHFREKPTRLSALGMNWTELHANPMADDVIAHDLNTNPTLPYPDTHFDDVVCAVSVDYLTQPLEVFTEVARVLRPGGRFVCSFSNRLFATKAIRGWLHASEPQRCEIVAAYFEIIDGFGPAVIESRRDGLPGDPLYAVWATRTASEDAA